MSSPPIRCVIRWWRIKAAAAAPSNCARHTICAPPATAAIAAALPKVPQNGTAPSSAASSRVECDAAGHVSGMPRDGLLIVQNQFRSACGSRSREGQTRCLADRWSGPASAVSALERQHRQSRKRRCTRRDAAVQAHSASAARSSSAARRKSPENRPAQIPIASPAPPRAFGAADCRPRLHESAC